MYFSLPKNLIPYVSKINHPIRNKDFSISQIENVFYFKPEIVLNQIENFLQEMHKKNSPFFDPKIEEKNAIELAEHVRSISMQGQAGVIEAYKITPSVQNFFDSIVFDIIKHKNFVIVKCGGCKSMHTDQEIDFIEFHEFNASQLRGDRRHMACCVCKNKYIVYVEVLSISVV